MFHGFLHRKCGYCSVTFHPEGNIFWAYGGSIFLPATLERYTPFCLPSNCLLFIYIQITVYAKVASAYLHMLVCRNPTLKSLLKAQQNFSAELLGVFSMQSWQLLCDASSLQHGSLRENDVFSETKKTQSQRLQSCAGMGTAVVGRGHGQICYFKQNLR